MQIGICTTDFDTMPMETLFSKIAQMGFSSVQLAFATLAEANFVPDGVCEIPRAIPHDLPARIASCAAAHNLRILCVNGTFNMAHPDAAAREDALGRFPAFAKAVRATGCDQVSLCTGTRNKDDLWAPHPDNQSPQAWRDALDSMRRIVKIAEDEGLTLLMETEASNVVDTPQRACEMMEQSLSPNVKMIMDCANLFHPGTARPQMVRPVIDRAFDGFGQHVCLAHGKDIRSGDGLDFCAAGLGIVDFPHMLRRLAQQGYKGDMVLHGIKTELDMPRALAFMRRCIADM